MNDTKSKKQLNNLNRVHNSNYLAFKIANYNLFTKRYSKLLTNGTLYIFFNFCQTSHKLIIQTSSFRYSKPGLKTPITIKSKYTAKTTNAIAPVRRMPVFLIWYFELFIHVCNDLMLCLDARFVDFCHNFCFIGCIKQKKSKNK